MKTGIERDSIDDCWRGLIRASHGRDRVLWVCNHKHRSSKTAFVCSRYQLGVAEGTMQRIWNGARAPRRP